MKRAKKSKKGSRPARKKSGPAPRGAKSSAKSAAPKVIVRKIVPSHSTTPLTQTATKRSRTVRGGLIQMSNPLNDLKAPVAKVAQAMLDKHLPMVDEAGKRGVQILCLQEMFNGPYFCPSQDPRWCDIAEQIPGPTVSVMQERAKKHRMAIIVPIYEREMAGVYYNTAAVIDADGTLLGKYRKNHIPHTNQFWEKFFFKPGNLGYPTFQTKYAKIGVYICYDRHFPEGARLLGLHGAEIVFNPSATVAGLSQYLWKLEQPAHAVANGYFMGCINRVGTEAPWNIGKFYGTSYFVDPRGNFLATGSETKDELVVADMNMEMIEETRRTWQFYRDRRPDSYGDMVAQLP
jgi:beta-ureidopropionase